VTPPDLKPIVNSLPEKPGVYKYFDKEGVIIYVGKAKSLKKRVSSYFTKKHHDNFKTSVLVSKIVHLEYTVVDTEMDALLLENSLIKEFQPKYNIALKDDKSYPYIKVTKERFPKVFAMFNPVRDGSEYFGPYANKKVMYTVLELIKKLYPVRNCNYNLSQANIDSFKFKVCLEYQIGNCKGPCEAYQTEDSYNEGIRQIRHILRGNLHEVKEHLKMVMMEASRRLAFEEAQEYKDKLDSLVTYQSRSTVVSPVLGDLEVYSTSSTDKISFVNFLRVSHGIIVISRNVEIRKKMAETDEEILVHVMGEMRKHYGDDVKEVVLPMQLDWPDDRITITVPKAGDKKKLIDLSLKNAMLYKHEKLTQYEKLNPSVRVDRLLEQMKNDLHLKDLPRHIECFDNSNFQGTYPVSACVVFKDGKPAKNDYRHFNVKTVVGPDDFETMKEVITRRYSRLRDENQPMPQLIVVDGGKGQLSHAVEALKALGLYGQMAIIGIAKRLEEIYYPDDSVPLYIDKKSETLKIIQHMRDEAHRFGITHHRSRRDKGTLKTSLTEIPGIGPEKARQLLKEFKSITRIKDSSIETLTPVIGKAKAELVYQYFHGEES
jgi:excinuclease ABC subunit C